MGLFVLVEVIVVVLGFEIFVFFVLLALTTLVVLGFSERCGLFGMFVVSKFSGTVSVDDARVREEVE